MTDQQSLQRYSNRGGIPVATVTATMSHVAGLTFGLGFVAALSACSQNEEPMEHQTETTQYLTIDASSMTSVERSVQQMGAPLDASQRETFLAAIDFFTAWDGMTATQDLSGASAAASYDPELASLKRLKALEGFTAKQIIAKYKAAKASAPSSPLPSSGE